MQQALTDGEPKNIMLPLTHLSVGGGIKRTVEHMELEKGETFVNTV